MVSAYIALGSNVCNPRRQLQRAVAQLASTAGITLTGYSKLYRSRPIGPPGQADYCNAVVAVDTDLSPAALLNTLQALENQQGRVRTVRWGPRTLDLDMLLYGNQRLTTPRLTLPHPQLHVRPFVLQPLHDIAPALALPGGQSLAALLKTVVQDDLAVIASHYPWK